MLINITLYRTKIMEPDRYQQNHKYYIVGIICLVIGLSLLAFSLYIVPFLLFSWHYNMPDFVMLWLNNLAINYKLSSAASSWLVFLGFFLPAIIFVVIADILSNRIDNQIYDLKPAKSKVIKNEERAESRNLIVRIILIIIVVFILARLFQWTIAATA